MNVPLGNLITLPLSKFMFVVRNLWLEESFSNDFEYAQEKIEKLVDILDLGGEATIIDFAQHKLEVKKLEEQKINIEKGKQNGVMTFREVKLINHSELSRLQMIHMLVKNFNDNNHIQMAEYEKEIARLETEIEKLQLIVILYQDESEDEDTKYHTADSDPNNHIQMAAYEKEIARLKAENEQLQLIVDKQQQDFEKEKDPDSTGNRDEMHEIDGHESESENWMEDKELEENGMVGKKISPYIGVASTQNPYCITIATKRKLAPVED